MTPGPFVPLGRVVKTHGLKGEVSVAPAKDLPFVFPYGLQVWFVPPPKKARGGRIESIRRGPKGPLVKVSGINDVDQAATLIGTDILACEDELPDSWFVEIEEEFSADGMRVTDEKRGLLGEVVETIITGANDVWVVHGPYGEVLLPVIDDVVMNIDEDAGEIAVRLLPGLMPGEGEEV